MNKRLRIILTIVILLGTGVLVYRHFAERDAPLPVNAEVVEAAAAASRQAQESAPPVDDIHREGRAAPGAMQRPGNGR